MTCPFPDPHLHILYASFVLNIEYEANFGANNEVSISRSTPAYYKIVMFHLL